MRCQKAMQASHRRIGRNGASVFLMFSFLLSTVYVYRDLPRLKSKSFPQDYENFYSKYHSTEELLQRLKDFTRYVCPLASLETLSHSHEGRPILLVRIGETLPQSPSRFLITGGMHGRERSTTIVAMYAMEKFCDLALQSAYDNSFRRVEGLFVALMNPDGQEHSRTVQERWRKNRRPHRNDKIACEQGGVDLNRNWPAYWGQGNGTSFNPCHDQYIGTKPLSEPETSGVARVISSNPCIRAHVDLHSFGQFLYRGWAYPETANTSKELFAEKRQRRLARAMRIAIRQQFGTDMIDLSARLATLHLTNRIQGGTLLDFAMKHGIPSVTVELGPKVTKVNAGSGFATNETDLLMRCQEMFAGLQLLLVEADPRKQLPLYEDKEIGVVLP